MCPVRSYSQSIASSVQQRFERRYRGQRQVEELPGSRLAEPRDERRRIELEAGEHLSAVSRAGAPAGALALEHEHRCARTGELAGSRKPGVARTNDRDVEGARFEPFQDPGSRLPFAPCQFHAKCPELYPTNTDSYSTAVLFHAGWTDNFNLTGLTAKAESKALDY